MGVNFSGHMYVGHMWAIWMLFQVMADLNCVRFNMYCCLYVCNRLEYYGKWILFYDNVGRGTYYCSRICSGI